MWLGRGWGRRNLARKQETIIDDRHKPAKNRMTGTRSKAGGVAAGDFLRFLPTSLSHSEAGKPGNPTTAFRISDTCSHAMPRHHGKLNSTRPNPTQNHPHPPLTPAYLLKYSSTVDKSGIPCHISSCTTPVPVYMCFGQDSSPA